MTTWRVRPAVLADARGIGEVHVATWRVAYAGIVPQAHLDALSAERRAAMWTEFFGRPAVPGQEIWVADDVDPAAPDGGRRIVGFANGGPSRDAGAEGLGELRALYVLPSHWDTGAGLALHDRAVGALQAAGFPAATLWVLADNARARRFYERRGWRPDGEAKTLDILGVALAEVRYRVVLAE